MLAVIAKAPTAGRVKTRLCPPCTPEEAAALAEAALLDTVAAMRATAAAAGCAVILDGPPGPWLPPDFDVHPQRGSGLDERLARAFEDLGGPALILGMDTPHVTPAQLGWALTALQSMDAVIGPAMDGGFWAIGLRRPDPRALLGIPMSAPETGRRQRERLDALGHTVGVLDTLRDVDDIDDVRAVARLAPRTSFAARAQRLAA